MSRETTNGFDAGLTSGLFAAMLAIAVWAAPSTLAKAMEMPALQIVLLRGWVGVLLAVAALYISGGKLSLRVVRKTLWAGVALGIDLIFFFLSLKLTTVANATLISAMTPVLLIFGAPFFFQERVRLPDISGALVAIGGLALVALGSRSSAAWSLEGDLLSVITLVAWTGYLIQSKRATELSALEFTAGVTLVASILVTPFALATADTFVAVDSWYPLGIAAMASMGWLGHVLMNWALRRIPVWVGGASVLAIPVVASALAALFLAEPLSAIQLVGMTIVVISLTYVGSRSPKVLGSEPSSPPPEDGAATDRDGAPQPASDSSLP